MARIVLHRYPRLEQQAVHWSGWFADVDGQLVETRQVSELWDANSTLRFGVQVSVSHDSTVGLDSSTEPSLVLSCSCRETALSISNSTELQRHGEVWLAETWLTVAGADIAEELVLDATVVAPLAQEEWLANRIVAEKPSERVLLSQDQQGFPVSVVSFKAEKKLSAPWHLTINATDPTDAFTHSVRLLLNEDYPQIRELVDGKPSRTIKALLDQSIARELIATATRLARDSTRPIDEVPSEFPESMAAAAAKVADQYLGMSLSDACRMYEAQPERLDYRLMSGTHLLEGEA